MRKNMLRRGSEQELWSDCVSKGKKNIRDWRSRSHESEWVNRGHGYESEGWTWHDSFLGMGRFYMIIFFFVSNIKRTRGSILMDRAGTEMWAPFGRVDRFTDLEQVQRSRVRGALDGWTSGQTNVSTSSIFFVKIVLCLLLFPFLFASQENCDANKTNFLSFMQRISLWLFFLV